MLSQLAALIVVGSHAVTIALLVGLFRAIGDEMEAAPLPDVEL
jgi:hypothetical protein